MSKRYARNPGSDQVAKWKAALADRAAQQRRQRYRPRPGAPRVYPRSLIPPSLKRAPFLVVAEPRG
jgi:hypothetical protein